MVAMTRNRSTHTREAIWKGTAPWLIGYRMRSGICGWTTAA